jgi:S-adenosylmethionine:tRNA ribosyltransferase-isomerase
VLDVRGRVAGYGVGLCSDTRGGAARCCLEGLQAEIDASPAGAHEVDEEREVFDSRSALREELALEALQAPDRVVQEASDLGDVAADGENFRAQPVADCGSDLSRDRRFELSRRGGEGLDLRARALERCLDPCGLDTSGASVRDALRGALQCEFVHGARGYSPGRMDTALLEYELPGELIAQEPLARRDESRLLVYRRATGGLEHRRFTELPELLSGELVVVNDTRVAPARLRARRATGGSVEVLLVESTDAGGVWEALVRPSRKLREGEGLDCVELLRDLGGGRWLVRVAGAPAGEMPLPPYIHRSLADPERYQTVYAAEPGSAAAPTAGLHFTPELLARLDTARVTLHVGPDTFRPVQTDLLEEHELHGERYHVEPGEWERIAGAERVLAVGTTTVRVLETIAITGELSGRTSLFVMPGCDFRRVDALLTNFHLPRSTLLALVMAFVGVEKTRELYRLAIAERYRFYSFGDAMLVL